VQDRYSKSHHVTPEESESDRVFPIERLQLIVSPRFNKGRRAQTVVIRVKPNSAKEEKARNDVTTIVSSV
jgi:hypothetical protein